MHLLIKRGIFNHSKSTKNDQLIFFLGRVHDNKATQKFSQFYHASTIYYELNKFST